MRSPRPLPPNLGTSFTLAEARRAGVERGRLGGSDLEVPFRGVRVRRDALSEADATANDEYEARLIRMRGLAHAYAAQMRPPEFFSHLTAAHLWGAPAPWRSDDALDVSVFGAAGIPRGRGVHGHRADARTTVITVLDGLPLTTPASTWASLGELPLETLVILGDYFCRTWREGFLRQNAGRPPLATRTQLAGPLDVGRRAGGPRLRTALGLIREDSWSPRETLCRLILPGGGLPEPRLNIDVYGPLGFLACVDMAYPEYRVAIEYQGQQHGARYAKDIERIEALRNAGWIVIQVTSALIGRRGELVARVRNALISRGWRP
jgi:hypothetical protein